jgi:MFS family permease
MLKSLAGGGIAQAMRHRHYRHFVTGDGISLVGIWVQRVAMGWLTWELTHSGLWLGILAMAELFPSVVCAPLGGALADKYDRRRIAFAAEVLLLAQALALAFLTWTGLVDIWWLLGLTLLRGIINAGSHPARQALVPSLVPPEDMSSAIAFNSMVFNIARFIGPAVAGVIIARLGIASAFAYNAASFLVFIVVLARLQTPYAEQFTRKHQSLYAQMAEGLTYIAGHAGIWPMLVLLTLTSVLVRPLTDLLPGYAGAVFQSGATGLAWLTSAMGLGSMVAAFGIAQRGRVAGLTSLAVANSCVMAVATVAFAFAPNFWLALVLLAAASYGITVTGVGGQALIQSAVPGELRGRVVSIYGMIFRAAPATGALAIGALSEVFGWRWPLAISALLCLLAWLWARSRLKLMAAALES